MRRPWIIVFSGALHICWGLLLLASRAPLRATALHNLGVLVPVPGVLAFLLLVIGLAALYATTRPPGPGMLLLLAPQQILLVVSAGGAIAAMYAGHFADGVARPSAFIAADQLGPVLLSVLHAASVIDIHASRPARARPG